VRHEQNASFLISVNSLHQLVHLVEINHRAHDLHPKHVWHKEESKKHENGDLDADRTS
jgi:hypothetical protein